MTAVNVKYCGGCNPHYDRAAFARQMTEAFPQIDFRFGAADDADAVVVICGCVSACAEVTDSYGSGGRFVLWGAGAKDALYRYLEDIQRENAGSQD